MSKTVKVTYNSDTLETTITVDGKSFDTTRINGKEIADWAYPFMMRKIKWNGFYDEMVEALGGEKEFNLVFEGSEADLNELKEAWEDAPVIVVSEESSENIVVIEYDENSLTTNITVNGKPFDTSRINGREIEDWVYPFTIRKIKWNGIFEEMVEALGGESKFTLVFKGSEDAFAELKEALEDTSVEIVSEKCSENNSDELKQAEEFYIHGKKEAFPIFEKFAEQGNARAMYFLGECHRKRYYGIPRDREKSIFWRKKGAEAGDSLAKLSVAYDGDMNEGQKIISNVFPEIKKMAEDGDVIAQYELSIMYIITYVDIKDDKIGIEWLMKSANGGFIEAQGQLAIFYSDGTAVEKNLIESVKWYTKAAEQGDVMSQNHLGNCYYNGEGVAQDYAKAVEWYTKAAEMGNAEAQNMLGKCYYYGDGVAKNHSKAMEWLKKAAEQGNEEAQDTLELIEACDEPSFFDKTVNALTSDTAKKIGKGFLKGVGTFLGAAAQGYSQAGNYYYDDDNEDY